MSGIPQRGAYGKALGSFWEIEGQDIPIWRAYDLNNYYPSYDKFAIATKYVVNNIVGGMEALFKTDEIINEGLDTTYEIIIREDMKKGEGLSAIEPVWDTLFALETLDEQGAYYAIRYGAGMRYLKIPESKLENKAYMSNIFKLLRGAYGVNGMFTLPYTTMGGTKESVELGSETPVQLNFLQLRDLLLGTLSAQTGIPREVWLGSETGLRSSEKNEDRYFDVLQAIQDDYRQFFKWFANKLNESFKWFGKAVIIDIEYVSRNAMSPEEVVDDVGKKIDIASKAGFNVPKEYLEGVLGIPLEEKEIDPLGINKDPKDPKEPNETDDDEEESEEEPPMDDEDEEEEETEE